MGVNFQMNDAELRLGLGELKAGIADKPGLLNIAGLLMRASVARTFREEGSPAGSWPKLALSTLRNKKYTGGHKLLILSGRLFSSIAYQVEGDTLTIGTNVVYARVQQEGSMDRRGSAIGPQARLADRSVAVKAFDWMRTIKARGRGKNRVAARQTKGHTGAHTRHQNIPPRQFLVIRPEDPQRIVTGWENFLAGRAIRLGMVGGGR